MIRWVPLCRFRPDARIGTILFRPRRVVAVLGLFSVLAACSVAGRGEVKPSSRLDPPLMQVVEASLKEQQAVQQADSAHKAEAERREQAASIGSPVPVDPDRMPNFPPPIPGERRVQAPDRLPPPPDARFVADISHLPPDIVERSTWHPGCPVPLEELRYITVAFWGFDGRPHTGELILHQSVAEDVVGVFARMHELRFPIEEMRIVEQPDLTGEWEAGPNNSSSFVCRSAAGSHSWSEHARGLSVDLNPYHNPYVKGTVIIPTDAWLYADRTRHLPGMVTPEVIQAFRDIGWGWGGDWTSLTDPMHFSATGH